MTKASIQKGFTLIELMITIAIAGIVLAVAVPSFKSMMINNRTITTANKLVAALSFAKSEAVRTGQTVVIHRKGTTSQDWSAGWDVFYDTNGDGDYDAGTDTLLKTFAAIPTGYTLTTGGTFADSLAYQSTGLIVGAAGDTFLLCDSDGDEAKAREIVLNTTGRVRTKTGTTATCP